MQSKAKKTAKPTFNFGSKARQPRGKGKGTARQTAARHANYKSGSLGGDTSFNFGHNSHIPD